MALISFVHRKWLILTILVGLSSISFGLFENFFSWTFVGFVSIKTLIGFGGLWVMLRN